MVVSQTSLYAMLSQDHRKSVKTFEQYLSTRLSKIMVYYGDYTDHGIGHAERTLDVFCRILEKRGIVNELDEPLALIGICACLLHDIGMGPITSIELRESAHSGFVLDEDRKKRVRERHHERTADWILHSDEAKQNLDWFPKDYLVSLANVAMAHRKIPIASYGLFADSPDLAFVAALLRLADQMDLSEDRVTHLGITRHDLPLEGDEQTIQMLKNLAGASFYLEDDGDRLLLKSNQPVDNVTLDGLRALSLLVEEIEETLAQTRDICWRDRAVLPQRISCDFHVQGESSSAHALKADFKQVWLYLSRYLYEGPYLRSIPLREAMANAIDACILRTALQPDADCRVEVQHLGDVIVLEDNGIGMSKSVIENHLKVLGSSYYKSPWFLGNPNIPDVNALPLIGEYGIGVFSYRLMSDQFEIVTGTETDGQHRVLFSDAFGVTLDLPAEQGTHAGTVVRFRKPRHEPERWLNSQETLKELLFWFPVCDIPVKYSDGGVDCSIGARSWTGIHKVHSTGDGLIISLRDQASYVSPAGGFRVDVGLSCRQWFLDNLCTRLPQTDTDFLAFMTAWKTWRGRDAHDVLPVTTDACVMFRGLRLPNEHIRLGLFGEALLRLIRTPLWLAQAPFGWVDKASASNGPVGVEMHYWIKIDDSHNRPSLSKLELRNKERATETIEVGERKLENLFASHCASLLRDPGLPWVLKEALRFWILERMRFDGLPSDYYENTEYLLDAVFREMLCLDAASRSWVKFGDIMDLSRETKLCFAPFTRSLQDSVWWSVRHYCILFPIRMLKNRSRLKTEVELSTDLLHRGLNDKGDYHVYYVFFGEEGSIPSVEFLEGLMRHIGFTDVLAIDDNRHWFSKQGLDHSRLRAMYYPR